MTTLVDLAKQVPSLFVLALFGITFLRHLEKRDQVNAETMAKRDHQFAEIMQRGDEAVREIGGNCHDMQQKCINVIQQNTKMYGEIAEALRRINVNK